MEKKKIAIIVGGATVLIAVIVALALSSNNVEKTVTESIPTAAGIDAVLDKALTQEASEINEVQMEEEVVEEPEISPEEAMAAYEAWLEEVEWANKLMANVEEALNVRTAPSTEAPLAGKLRKGDLAEIAGVEDGWVLIKSGNLVGYVSSEYCVVGSEAREFSDAVCKEYATATDNGLRIRKEPSTDSEIIDVILANEKVEVNDDGEAVEGWVPVLSGGEAGYVKSEYVTIATEFGAGVTVAEEQAAREAEEKAAREAEEKNSSKDSQKKGGNETKQNSAVAASHDDVTLLGAIIQCEAGNSGDDGRLAVGAVVVNRARRRGMSISSVIYQPGQFPPATNGKMAGVLARGVSPACLQAAQLALSGMDNTGGATSFRSARSGAPGVVIGGNVFF